MKNSFMTRLGAGFLAVVLVMLLVIQVQPATVSSSGSPEYVDVTPQEVLGLIRSNMGAITLLDVRTPAEFESGHINGAKLIPVSELENRAAELDLDNLIMVYCKAGVRSQAASAILAGHGFTRIYNLSGGIEAWKAAGLPVIEDNKTEGCAPCLERLTAASPSSSPGALKLQSSAPGYCPSSGGMTFYEYISSVSYEEVSKGTLAVTVNVYITNPNGCVAGKPCGTYDSSPEYVNGWIDWNGDKSFDESERIIDAALTGYNGIGYSGTMATSCTVPVPDEPPTETWMRVNLGWSHDPNGPCETYWTYGNVVDTLITFTDLSVKSEEISITTPSKPADMVTISFKIHNNNKTDPAEDVEYKITKLFEGNEIDDDSDVVDIPADGVFTGSIAWAYDFDQVIVEVDPEENIDESNEENNTAETHSISGSVENNGGDAEAKTKVEYMEQSGANWVTKYTCYTDDAGDYTIITNFNAITDKATGKIRSSLDYSPEREAAKTRFKIYDDAEWGVGRNKAANAKTYSAETAGWVMDITKDYSSKDVKFPVHNCLVVYDTLVKAYKYWSGLNPSLAPANLAEVEVNDDDYADHTSYRHGNILHFWHTRSDKTSTIAHEYTHLVAGSWGIQYNPVGENFANYGSAMSRGVSTYDYWGTEIDLNNLEDTNGDKKAGGAEYGEDVWWFQLAGVYWELDNGKLLAGLRQGAATAKDVYDKYKSHITVTKAIFRKHGISTAGWLPAGPEDPDMFTGVYSVYKVDANSDGKAEFLKIDCGLNIPAAGNYYLYGFLEDASGAQYCFASKQQDLSAGNRTVTLSFDGRSIYEKRLTGYYTLASVYLADNNYNELDYRINPFTTPAPYSYTEFLSPAMYLTGSFTDSGVDTDSDTLYDFLRVGVQMNLATAGTYRIESTLKNQAGNILLATAFKNLTAGNQYINLDFDGAPIRGLGINGPYTLQGVYVFDTSDLQVYSNDVQQYNTAAYLFTQFETGGAVFTGVVTNQGTDTDSDTLFNNLTLGFSLSTTIAGNYQVKGQLYSSDDTFITSTLSNLTLGAGTSNNQINLDGASINQQKVDGPYAYVLDLYNSDYVLVGQVTGNTSAYTYPQFQGPPQDQFILIYSDAGSDTNSDGLFEFLRVNISSSTVKSGTYKLGGYLYDQNNQLVSYTSVTEDLNSTPRMLHLDFDGKQIWSSIGGVFHLTLDINNPDDSLAARIENAYSTASYNPALFSPAEAALSNSYSDQGSDVNFDTLFEYLDISVGLNISTSGIYTVEGSLFDANGNGLGNGTGTSSLGSGNQAIVLHFSGKAIYENGENGPYKLAEIKLLDSEGKLLIKTSPGYLTSNYNFNLFGPLIRLTGAYSDAGTDSNSDSVYEFLTVNVGVVLANDGNCVASARLVDSNGSEITAASSTTPCEAGTLQTVKLEFPGPAIYNHGVNGPYLVKDIYIYHTGDPNSPDYAESYTTGMYQYKWFGEGGANEAPVAMGDNYGAAKNTTLSVTAPGLLGNDTDLENDPLTAIKVSDPQHGTVTISPDGSFVYIPTNGYTGTDSFTYKANDGISDSNIAVVSLTIEIIAVITPSQLPPAEVKNSYGYSIHAMGGTTALVWSVPKTPKGNALPAGLKLTALKGDPSTALLSGKPSASIKVVTSYSFYIQVADKAKPQNVKIKPFSITIYPSITLSLPPSTLSTVEVGVPVLWSPSASGGTGNFIWTTKSALPTGFSLNSQTGIMSISISTFDKSSYPVVLVVSDNLGGTANKSVTFKIIKPVTITPPLAKKLQGTAGKSYSLSLSKTGGKSSYSWSIDSGDFPGWAVFNVKSGAISVKKGFKTTTGTSTFTVKVQDALGAWDTQEITIVIN